MARRDFYTGKYALSKAEYRSAYYYALRYTEMCQELEAITDTVRAITYDGDLVQSSGAGRPTEQLAIRRSDLSKSIQKIEQSAKEAIDDEETPIYKMLLFAVTTDGVTFNYLKGRMEIPCSRNYFYERRRRFYWLLAQKI